MTKPTKTVKRQNPTLDEIQMRMAAGVKTGFVQGRVIHDLRSIALIEYVPRGTDSLFTSRYRVYAHAPGMKHNLVDTRIEKKSMYGALIAAIAHDSCPDSEILADAACRVLGLHRSEDLHLIPSQPHPEARA